jgi:hypothetical protein
VDRDTAPLPRAIQPSNPLAATRLNQGMRASPLADSGGPSYAAAGALRSGAASLRTTLPRAACTAGRRFFPEGSIRIAATMTFTPSHFPTEQRSVLRAVALAYRRAYRAGGSQGECHDAALREYRRLCPDAPADDLAASGEVNRMIAAAINANSKWFWDGPDV